MKCTQCGLVTDIRRKERMREKKLKKEKSPPYVPVEVICSCGEIIINEMKSPWGEDRDRLKKIWQQHKCKTDISRKDLIYG